MECDGPVPNPADSAARPRKRVFIAHRGVNMRSTVAGENSLEAIRLAKAAGFGAIETDVRLSADGALVVMHDSTLNRTCLHADGTPLSEPVAVAGKTLRELRSDYILKAADPACRTRIPTLEEYLAECARNGLYTFIERNSTTRRDGITATSSPRPTPHWDATATSSPPTTARTTSSAAPASTTCG